MKQSELIYGIHAVHTVLNTRPKDVLRLFIQSNRQDKKINEIKLLATKHNIVCEEISTQEFHKLVNEDARHQGVVVKTRLMATWTENTLMESIKNNEQRIVILILDGVQ